MPELKISEAGTVQFPMVAHAAAIGWTGIPPEVALATLPLLRRGRDIAILAP